MDVPEEWLSLTSVRNRGSNGRAEEAPGASVSAVSPARTSVTFYPYLTGTVRLWTLQTFPESHEKKGDSRRKSVDLDRSTSGPAFQRPGFQEQEHQQLRAVHCHLVRRAEEKTTGGLGVNSSKSQKSELWVMLGSNEQKTTRKSRGISYTADVRLQAALNTNMAGSQIRGIPPTGGARLDQHISRRKARVQVAQDPKKVRRNQSGQPRETVPMRRALTCFQGMPSRWYSSCSCFRTSWINSCCSFSLQ